VLRAVDAPHATPDAASADRTAIVAGTLLLAGLVIFGWAAPATFYVYKMVHVMAAVVWVGGGASLVILVILTQRESDPRALVSLGQKIEVIATRVFVPASLVVLLFGILMMLKGDLDWGQFWVIAGLLGFAATFVTGLGVLTPRLKRFNALAETKGPADPETQAALRTILLIARFDIAMLLLVVADMTAKPFA